MSQDILAEGIHVITTLNIQHLESLYDVVEKATHVRIRERIPDTVLAEADQLVNVDLTTEDLQKRLLEGKIYPPERIQTALENFFKEANLEKLRELTLRELASQIDQRRRETPEEEAVAAPDQIMVCLSSRGPRSEALLRYASRLAGKLNRNWYAVYVQTPSEEPTVIDAHTQKHPLRHPDPRQAAGGDGLHVQGGGHRGHHSPLCPGIPARDHRRGQPDPPPRLEAMDGGAQHGGPADPRREGDDRRRSRHAGGRGGALRGRLRRGGKAKRLPREPPEERVLLDRSSRS